MTHHSIALVTPLMILLEAGINAQVLIAQLALDLAPPTPCSTPAALDTLAWKVSMLWPMTQVGPASCCWDVRLYMSELGGMGGRYLRQQLLAKVQ